MFLEAAVTQLRLCKYKLHWDALSPVYMQWSIPQSHLVLVLKPSEHTSLVPRDCDGGRVVPLYWEVVWESVVESLWLSEYLRPFACVALEFLSFLAHEMPTHGCVHIGMLEICVGMAKTPVLCGDSSLLGILQHLTSVAYLSIPSDFSLQPPGV